MTWPFLLGFLLAAVWWLRGRRYHRAAKEAWRLREVLGAGHDPNGPRWAMFREKGF